MPEKFESPRAVEEKQRRHRYEVFDMMADLALAGAMDQEEAFANYRAVAGLQMLPDSATTPEIVVGMGDV